MSPFTQFAWPVEIVASRDKWIARSTRENRSWKSTRRSTEPAEVRCNSLDKGDLLRYLLLSEVAVRTIPVAMLANWRDPTIWSHPRSHKGSE